MEHGQPHAWVDFNPHAVAGFNSRKMTMKFGSIALNIFMGLIHEI
jgi:hypothetical protein